MEELKKRIQGYKDSRNADPHVLNILNAVVDVLEGLVIPPDAKVVLNEPVKEEPRKWEKK